MGSISLHNTLISLSFVLLFVFLSALFFSSFCILWPGICNFLLPNSINDKMRAQQQQSNNKKPQPEQEPATGALQVTGDCLSCCSPYWLLLFFFFFLSFPPFYLSVSVLCCDQHTKPHLAPSADGVVCFLFCTRFMSCGNWIVSGIEQWLLSVRSVPTITRKCRHATDAVRCATREWNVGLLF